MIIPIETIKPSETVEDFAVDHIRRWFDACDQFLDWQRAHMLVANPTPETVQQHRRALRFLLRFTRSLHGQATDPDFSDRAIVEGLEIRLKQLEDSWGIFHDSSMTAEQADTLLAKVFPE